ncbi:MAG: RnfABCDGE type electron transport complex subunit A [bacterium]|nr:RnfABCDGE type electron transport complex subunit A [bacterium]
MDYFIIIIGAVFVNNIVLAQFFGICPFLGVSTRVTTAAGMSAAVMFVMTLATLVTFLIQTILLAPLQIEFLQTVAFILIIASLVQMVELILKKVSQPLYQALGVFLPLITTNCAIMGVAVQVTRKNFNLVESIVYSVGISIGFGLAMILFAGLRERQELFEVPEAMKGAPIALVAAGLLSLAFMGFAGMV